MSVDSELLMRMSLMREGIGITITDSTELPTIEVNSHTYSFRAILRRRPSNGNTGLGNSRTSPPKPENKRICYRSVHIVPVTWRVIERGTSRWWGPAVGSGRGVPLQLVANEPEKKKNFESFHTL
ncbi:hypothetical protein NL676_004004 [Syzygium grande]|nr:hypothetical protein NL676_004004 [Syzygium grande]